MQELYDHFDEIVARMDDQFNTHQFILELARSYQREYIEALYEYRNSAAPFQHVHGQISRRLSTLTDQITRDGDSTAEESKDIFGQQQGCARWRKKK